MVPRAADTEELIARAGRGDTSARERLLVRHRDRLRRMVAVRLDRRLAPRVDASDVVQEALLDAAQKLSDYLRQRPLPFYPWLRRLAWEHLVKLHQRHLHTRKRSASREEQRSLALPDESALELAQRLVAPGTSPSHRLLREEWRGRVQAALTQLPENDREVLVLRYLEQLSMSEIAAVLGIQEGAVKMRHTRALQRLNGLLGGGPRRTSNDRTRPPPGPVPRSGPDPRRPAGGVREQTAGGGTGRTGGVCPGAPRAGRRVAAPAARHPGLGRLGTFDRRGGGFPCPRGPAPPTALGELGDFRLLREVGRGGMGVVYEAEQVSLGRRVALKVLPFAAALDPRQLQRFQNEARAAASLQHPHIVPVHAVGCERGVHYYAMQFIDGQTLEALIRQRREPGGSANPGGSPTPPSAETAEEPRAQAATRPNVREPACFRCVAEWGVQAAEALEHAHALGIVYRDVKPANLMVDAQGTLWVTDFGLARTVADAGLAMSGDLLGTPRYMSPEQALAKHGLVDHRTDVYSLGATLYELLTGRPAVEGQDRQELLKRIADEEPRPPRSLNRAIPADLETIVLKALAKEPAERYVTAKGLADDLRRFLSHEPIRARRASLAQRASKWGKRHRAVVLSAGAALLAVAIASSVSAALVLAAYQSEKDAHRLEKEQRDAAQKSAAAERQAAAAARAERRRAEDNLRKAVEAWGQSFEFFLERPPSKDTPELAAARKAQTEQASRFLQGLLAEVDNDPARCHEAAMVHGTLGSIYSVRGRYVSAEEAFSRSVALYRGLIAEDPEEPRYQTSLQDLYSPIMRVAADLHINAADRSNDAAQEQQVLEQYARAARLYALIPANWLPPDNADSETRGTAHTRILAEPLLLLNMAQRLYSGGRPAEAEMALDRSIALGETVPARFPGQVYLQFYWRLGAQARSLRGLIRWEAGREAEDDYRRAADLFAKLTPEELAILGAYPDLACLEQSRGELLWARGDRREAAGAFDRAEAAWRMVTNPANLRRHRELAWFLATCPDERFRKAEEAAALAEQAVTGPQATNALAWRTRGVALFRAGRPRSAVEALEKGMALGGGGEGVDWFFLAMAYQKLDEQAKAREWYDQATAWAEKHRPKDPRLARFRAEAAALLGIPETPMPKFKEESPRKD